MVAKIKPLPVKFTPGERSMQNAYAERGWMRHPGTAVGRVPYRTQSGKYLTGLDEDSDKIRRLRLTNPTEGERVAKETKERRERLEAATGLDLGPRSEYYSGVYGIKYGTDEVARKVKLMDRENVFNFNIPQEEITYYWLKEHDYLIAPSLVEWESGKSPHTVQFYVENEAAEAEIVYKKNTSIVDAVRKLTQMNLDTRKKVAKLCGISIAENDNELSVYNKLYEFINDGLVKTAKFKGQDSVNVFNRIADMSTPVMNARFMVDQAIELRIYNKRNGVMYEGENMVSATEEELIDQLASGNRAQEMMALEIKINDKRKLRGNIEGLSYVTAAQLAPQKPNVTVEKPVTTKTDNLAKARATRTANIAKKKAENSGSNKEAVNTLAE
jgi:hypothetical protein